MVACTSAYLLSTGYLWAGGVVLLVSGVFDLLDGALARATNRASDFGALLDSVVDRISEMLVLMGLLIFFLQLSSTEGVILVYLTLGCSVLVSYLRARAESLGVECKVGIMARPGRVISLGVGLVLGHWWLTGLLTVIAVTAGLSLLTLVQRLLHTWRALKM